jgi:preprotein translocase subunit YajC
MSSLISTAHAQATGAAPAAGGQMTSFLFMAAIIVVFYFVLIRPQQKRAKEHQAMLAKLAAGDEVITAGGIVGRVTEVGESFIVVEIADNVRIKVQRAQISSLLPKGTYKGA